MTGWMNGRVKVVALVVLAVALAGCGGIAERATERAVEGALGQATGADVEIDRDGESFRVESDEGSFEFGSTTELPDDFPTELPLPDGLEILNASRMADDDSMVMSIMGSTGQDFEAVVAWFKDQLPGAGWDVGQESEMSSDDYKQAAMHATGHGYEATILVQDLGDEQEGTTVNLTVQQAGAEN